MLTRRVALPRPAAQVPFDAESVAYVAAIDAKADAERLARELDIRPECLRTMRVSTMLLKKGVACGLLLSEIVAILCRGSDGRPLDKPSVLERICR